MCHMLFWVTLLVKLLEFWRLIATGHVERIDPVVVRLGVEVSLSRTSTQLYFDCIYNQVLNLLGDHQAWRPTILEFAALLRVHPLVGSFTLEGRPFFLLAF